MTGSLTMLSKVKIILPILLAMSTTLIVSPSRAATFEVQKGGSIDVIAVRGEMFFGDESKFANLALGSDNAVVIFESPGGNLKSGIEIGRTIRIKGFATVVPDGGAC